MQVGHWEAGQLPQELSDLRDQTGGDFGPWREIDVNLPVASLVAELLRQDGVVADRLPATVPPGYKADAFLAVHADRDPQQRWRGYKVAPSAISQNRTASKKLSDDIATEYAVETQLPPDIHEGAITPNMLYYYAFNWKDFQHAVGSRVPAAIVETGFDSNAEDRDVIYGQQPLLAKALADGIERFLRESVA